MWLTPFLYYTFLSQPYSERAGSIDIYVYIVFRGFFVVLLVVPSSNVIVVAIMVVCVHLYFVWLHFMPFLISVDFRNATLIWNVRQLENELLASQILFFKFTFYREANPLHWIYRFLPVGMRREIYFLGKKKYKSAPLPTIKNIDFCTRYWSEGDVFSWNKRK